jgi:hypothetical protein
VTWAILCLLDGYTEQQPHWNGRNAPRERWLSVNKVELASSTCALWGHPRESSQSSKKLLKSDGNEQKKTIFRIVSSIGKFQMEKFYAVGNFPKEILLPQ